MASRIGTPALMRVPRVLVHRVMETLLVNCPTTGSFNWMVSSTTRPGRNLRTNLTRTTTPNGMPRRTAHPYCVAIQLLMPSTVVVTGFSVPSTISSSTSLNDGITYFIRPSRMRNAAVSTTAG